MSEYTSLTLKKGGKMIKSFLMHITKCKYELEISNHFNFPRNLKPSRTVILKIKFVI